MTNNQLISILVTYIIIEWLKIGLAISIAYIFYQRTERKNPFDLI